MDLARSLAPAGVVAVHAPLGCVIDAQESFLAAWLAERAGLPLRRSVPSPTPGAFDTWAREQLGVPCVTFELPVISKDAALAGFLDLLVELITTVPIGDLAGG